MKNRLLLFILPILIVSLLPVSCTKITPVEVYINGCALTITTFPEPSSQGLAIFAEGGDVRLAALDIWEMNSMWE